MLSVEDLAYLDVRAVGCELDDKSSCCTRKRVPLALWTELRTLYMIRICY